MKLLNCVSLIGLLGMTYFSQTMQKAKEQPSGKTIPIQFINGTREPITVYIKEAKDADWEISFKKLASKHSLFFQSFGGSSIKFTIPPMQKEQREIIINNAAFKDSKPIDLEILKNKILQRSITMQPEIERNAVYAMAVSYGSASRQYLIDVWNILTTYQECKSRPLIINFNQLPGILTNNAPFQITCE